MRARSFQLVLVLLLAAACGDDGGGSGATDAQAVPADVNIAACGAIGSACGTGCPGDLECVEDVCAPMRGTCGGFAGEMCQDHALTCTYPQGSSAGICMLPDEKACLCAIAPAALADCMTP